MYVKNQKEINQPGDWEDRQTDKKTAERCVTGSVLWIQPPLPSPDSPVSAGTLDRTVVLTVSVWKTMPDLTDLGWTPDHGLGLLRDAQRVAPVI